MDFRLDDRSISCFFVTSLGNGVQECIRNCKRLVCLSILDILAPIDKHKNLIETGGGC